MATGTGTQQDPYLVSTMQDVLEKCAIVGAYVCLVQDIYVQEDPQYKQGTNQAIVINCAKFYSTNSGGKYKSICGYACIRPNIDYDYAFVHIGANTLVDHIGFNSFYCVRGYKTNSGMTDSEYRSDICCDSTSVITNCSFSFYCCLYGQDGVWCHNFGQPCIYGGNFENCSIFLIANDLSQDYSGAVDRLSHGFICADSIDSCYIYIKSFPMYPQIDVSYSIFDNISNSTVIIEDSWFYGFPGGLDPFMRYKFVSNTCSNSLLYWYTTLYENLLRYWSVDGYNCGVCLESPNTSAATDISNQMEYNNNSFMCPKSRFTDLGFLEEKGLTGFLQGIPETHDYITPIHNVNALGAFAYCDRLSSIDIPISTLTCGDFSFLKSGLSYAKIPPDLKYGVYSFLSNNESSNLYTSTLENGTIDNGGNYVSSAIVSVSCDPLYYFDRSVTANIGGREFIKINNIPACGIVIQFTTYQQIPMYISNVEEAVYTYVPDPPHSIISNTFTFDNKTFYVTAADYAMYGSGDLYGNLQMYPTMLGQWSPYSNEELATLLEYINFSYEYDDYGKTLRTHDKVYIQTGRYKVEVSANKDAKITAFLYSAGMVQIEKVLESDSNNIMYLDIPENKSYLVAFKFKYVDNSDISSSDISEFKLNKLGSDIDYWNIVSYTCAMTSTPTVSVGTQESSFPYSNCNFTITISDGTDTVTRRVESGYNVIGFDTSVAQTLSNMKVLFNGNEYPITGSIEVV